MNGDIKPRLIVIDDDVDLCLMLERFLTRKGYEVKTFQKGNAVLAFLEKENFDIAFCDFRLADIDGRELVKRIKASHPHSAVVMITGYSDVKIAVDVIKNGAYDYIIKPLLPDEMLQLIEKILTENKTGTSLNSGENGSSKASNGREYKEAREQADGDKYIVGRSTASKEIQREISLVAPTSYSVIIYGESGTGKESIAQSIHQQSKRKGKPFVAIDCGALSKELAGSELFGHEKGSFTGAVAAKDGQFEIANGGTIFLDEIANLSYEIQTSLLRVIQERKVRRLGSLKETEVDVRILIASNENLAEAVASGKFREDLYYRFNEFTIQVPPLRLREEDIPLFAEFFLQKTNAELDKSLKGFTPEVIDLFYRYSWPGNLRELNNIIKRSALLSDGDLIALSALPPELIHFEKFNFNSAGPDSNEKQQNPDLKSAALVAEQEMILKILRQVNNNKSKAAKVLNIDRKTLYNKMKILHIN